MNEEINDVTQESSPETVVEESVEEVVEETPTEEIVSEDVETPTPEAPKAEEKVVPYSRFKEVNDELAAMKKQPEKSTVALNVEDYIDISASLEGLDQREKAYLAQQHKLTGKPLSDIRNDEDFGLWQSAYRAKTEKEKLSLKPSGGQAESDKPKTLTEKLQGASLVDKERILTEAGLYKQPRPRSDRTTIGGAQ